METVIAAAVVVTLILLAALTLFQDALITQDAIAVAWRELEERSGDRARTDLTPIDVAVTDGGKNVEVTLRNDGDVKLANFDRWDVILQYYAQGSNNYETDWYPYVSTSPGNNEWTVAGIYAEAASSTAELFEPGVLNPGEELLLQLTVSPKVGNNTVNMIMISTDSGVQTSAVVIR